MTEFFAKDDEMRGNDSIESRQYRRAKNILL